MKLLNRMGLKEAQPSLEHSNGCSDLTASHRGCLSYQADNGSTKLNLSFKLKNFLELAPQFLM